VGETSDDVDDEAPVDWLGLPSPELVRATVGLLLAAALSVLGAFILGEYEFKGFLPIGAGILFGLVVGEVAVEVGRRRTVPVAVCCAALTSAGLLCAGWINAGQGLSPISRGAWLAAAVGAAAGALRVVGLRRS
jgi:hypothetical protein